MHGSIFGFLPQPYFSLIRDLCSFLKHESNQLLVGCIPLSKTWIFFIFSTSHPNFRTEKFLLP